MTWSVDTPMRAGSVTLVPIVEIVVSINGGSHSVIGQGRKRPLMFLVFRKDGVTGVDLHGKLHDEAEIERLFPEALARATAELAQDARSKLH